MGHTATFNDLVRSLYLASAGLEDINQSLRHAHRLFNSHMVACITTNSLDGRGHIPFGIGVNQRQRDNYQDNFAQKNVLMDACMTDLLAGKAVRSASYFTDTEFSKTTYYNEFMSNLDAFHNAGFIFGLKDDLIHTLVLGRGRHKHEYSDSEILYMTTLKPHVEAALHISSHVNLLKTEIKTKSSTLDHLNIGVCHLTKDLKITDANLIARQTLASGVFLRSENGLLTSGSLKHRDLRKMLHGMLLGIETNYRIKVFDATNNATCFFCVFPVLDSGDLSWVDSKEVQYVLFIGTQLNPRKHCKAFLISVVRQRCAAGLGFPLLLSECSLTKAALILRISHETARSHLKSIFMKMDIHSQSQLAVIVSQLNSVR